MAIAHGEERAGNPNVREDALAKTRLPSRSGYRRLVSFLTRQLELVVQTHSQFGEEI